jgi:5'-3' exonuclease
VRRFAVIDLSNLYHRARYGAMAAPEDQSGLALLIIFRSVRKLYRELAVDHIVFAADRGSWRSTVYPSYKMQRKLARMALPPRQQEAQRVFFETFDTLVQYLNQDSRCTVLAAAEIEGDDFIARWITRHPEDRHVIVSGDSDFVQLVSVNVQVFDAFNQRMLSHTGVTNERGEPLAFQVSSKDGKIKVGEPDRAFVPESDWWRKALFIKLVRGDSTDSVFSAYPGVRYAGKKCSIRAAWEDRAEQGYDWNNLMFQTWDKLLESGEVQTVRVIDEFRINEHLIDLTKQPAAILATMDAAIDTAIARPPVRDVGRQFLRFCTAHDLPALAKEAAEHVAYLNAAYPCRSS